MHISIIDRYIFREVALSWAAVTVVLFVILVSHTLMVVLVEAAGGELSVDIVLPLLYSTSINLLVTIVPLGLYLGVILGLGRMYQDSEMVVLSACGVGARRLYRPILMLGVLGILITLPLVTLVSPWAENWEQRIKTTANTHNLVAMMREGTFVEFQGGDVVLFTQTLFEHSVMGDVFMRQITSSGNQALENARSARCQVDTASGDQYLVFSDGQRTTIGEPEGGYQIIEYGKHGVRVPQTKVVSPRVKQAGKSTLDLFKSTKLADRAEFYWRIGIPLAAPLLAFLAVPLSHTSPRSGRYGKMAIAILIYIAYANVLVLSRKWIASGQIPEWLGLWWVHALLFVFAMLLQFRVSGVALFSQNRVRMT